ncbi:MAG: hypothetical protein AAFQ92_02580, partial [Bacteroidota bacterium]
STLGQPSVEILFNKNILNSRKSPIPPASVNVSLVHRCISRVVEQDEGIYRIWEWWERGFWE